MLDKSKTIHYNSIKHYVFSLFKIIIKKLVFCIFVSSIQYAEHIVNRLYALHICIYLYILIYISIYSHILHKYTKL